MIVKRDNNFLKDNNMLKNIKNNLDNKFNKIVEEKTSVIYKTSIENHNKENNKNNK